MSIFDIFRSKQVDFGAKDLKVDFHSHLIPGIDDGAKTLEDSLEMIRGLSELGYEKLITTPHIHWEYYRNNPAIVLDGLEKVRAAIEKEGIPIQLEAAAEYFMDEHFEELIEKEELLTFGNKYVLVEMSFFAPTPGVENMIFKIKTKGYRPILAHPERYGYWAADMKKYQKLMDMGAELQVNLLSLSGQYGKEVYKTAKKLINQDMVSYLGSDMHHQDHLSRLKKLYDNNNILKLLDRPWKNPELSRR